MNKYIEAMDRLMMSSFAYLLLSALVGVILIIAFMVSAILTNGLTLLAPLLWWGYIVYKEANK